MWLVCGVNLWSHLRPDANADVGQTTRRRDKRNVWSITITIADTLASAGKKCWRHSFDLTTVNLIKCQPSVITHTLSVSLEKQHGRKGWQTLVIASDTHFIRSICHNYATSLRRRQLTDVNVARVNDNDTCCDHDSELQTVVYDCDIITQWNAAFQSELSSRSLCEYVCVWVCVFADLNFKRLCALSSSRLRNLIEEWSD